jgi:16S rRNA (guanine1516-N2)-methyltransferase
VVKAIGKHSQRIADLTCGYGKDAYLFLCTGRSVVGVERNRIIFELLKDGVERAMENSEHLEIFKNFELFQSDAFNYVEALTEEQFPDVFYIDPMYPPRSTSALPRKDIQVLRRLLADDLNEDPVVRETKLKNLIELCLSKTKKRVVLKRPVWLTPLFPPKISFEGKLVRYDVYVRD